MPRNGVLASHEYTLMVQTQSPYIQTQKSIMIDDQNHRIFATAIVFVDIHIKISLLFDSNVFLLSIYGMIYHPNITAVILCYHLCYYIASDTVTPATAPTKSLCSSLLRWGVSFIAPMKIKNSPNRMDKLFSTIVDPTLVVGAAGKFALLGVITFFSCSFCCKLPGTLRIKNNDIQTRGSAKRISDAVDR